jgi:hypothetical protein
MVPFEKISLEGRQKIAQEHVNHVFRLKAAIDVVTKKNEDRTTLETALLNIGAELLQQLYQKVSPTVYIPDRVDTPAWRYPRRRPWQLDILG